MGHLLAVAHYDHGVIVAGVRDGATEEDCLIVRRTA